MLAPYSVRLVPHDPQWAGEAEREGQRILAGGTGIISVHHVGSTAIPGILAKPIIDLVAIAPDLATLDGARRCLEQLGYEWHGEYGLEGRRYCTLTDPVSGVRKFHLHCYAEGDHSIRRHFAFRDYLRAHPQEAGAYERMKQQCAAAHPENSHDYTKCKDRWIKRAEREALKRY
jgi:GrpB-like predicted nucleotidyltransferase (UPF0157 family)